MRVPLAIAVLGAAVVASSGVASAQTRADRTAVAAEVPWYERFTYSSGVSEPPPAWSTTNPRAAGAPIAPTARWGMTLNLGEQERLSRAESISPREEAAVGAFFRVTPSVRVGGRVSVAPQPVTPGAARRAEEEPSAGVKLESAFRF